MIEDLQHELTERFADQQVLQEELKPPQDNAPDALVVEMDGSILPIRGSSARARPPCTSLRSTQ